MHLFRVCVCAKEMGKWPRKSAEIRRVNFSQFFGEILPLDQFSALFND